VGVSLSFNPSKKQTVMAIRGSFTHTLRTQFFQAIAAVPDSVIELVIDLSETDELDASAMGMLIMLRDKHPGSECIIVLAPHSPIEHEFRTANFHQLFAFEAAE
jgi:anti-anti-sigma regulatory factor